MELFAEVTAQGVTKIFTQVLGLVMPIIVVYLFITIMRTLLEVKAGLGSVLKGVRSTGQSATDSVRKRAESSNWYQNKQMMKQSRDAERRRGNVQSYAELMSGNSRRAERARRRAAGGLTAQLLNTNAAGQQRIRQNAEDQLRKERHEEAERAAKTLAQMGFEGDDDFMSMARMRTGGTYTSTRTGQAVQVTEAVRQAAVNNLVKQGRTSQIRDLETYDENTGTNTAARLPGGVATTDLHNILDHAYEDYGQKLADKAPDLAPSRRASNGLAAFTDLKPEDVAGWHHSTVTAARNWYSDTNDAYGNALNGAQLTQRKNERERMVRSFAQAALTPATRSKLSLDQVTQARAAMQDAIAAGSPIDAATQNAIDTIYTQLGGV